MHLKGIISTTLLLLNYGSYLHMNPVGREFYAQLFLLDVCESWSKRGILLRYIVTYFLSALAILYL
jgi:hypothetical protein